MAEEIFGPFESVEETVKTVNILELEGYSNTNITIFAHGNHADKINDLTDVSVTSLESEEETHDQTFLSKIKKVFLNDIYKTSDIHDQLLKKGLSESQANDYSKKIEAGNILITSQTELKMGNDPTGETPKMTENVKHLYQ
ncbi:hypothetical protein GCM10008983_16010 [Lentibacillus halophilus]|uniref:General stress protein 17M-like domain-containing protein n=1 Tax=Lentibacillus halophilus TaxID=295065 RepID=A0ABN0Z998_9BACI